MAPQVQVSPSPLPPPHPGPDPPLTPMQHHAAGDSSERIPTPHSSPPAHSVAAAQYVPPRAATRTADPADGRSWDSWSGGRTAGPPPPQPPPRSQPQPPPPLRQQPRAAAPQAPAPASSVDRDHRVVSNILSRKSRAASLKRTALVARGAAAGLCLAALAVLAADIRKGWALDSYNRYSQLRYSEAVNVIGFLYSVFQLLAERMRRKKHLIPRPKGNYFDFIMDQVLAYLLISSSSSATARVGDWMDNWGSDPFPNMANSSIAISFLAFLVFAISSLISAYNLFRRDL